MGFTEFKVKDSEEYVRVYTYAKIAKVRKNLFNILGCFMVLAIIGQFTTYAFGQALLFTSFILVFWLLVSLILNWIFNPIIARSYLKEFGAPQELINEYSLRKLIQGIPFNRSWINPIVLIGGIIAMYITVKNHIDYSKEFGGRSYSVYVQEDYQNTILTLVAIIASMSIILYFNKKK